MATPRKPVVCLAFGIINIVLGSMAVLSNLTCACCLGVIYGGLRAVFQNVPAPERREFEELWNSATDAIPGLVLVVFIIEPLVGLVLGTMQLWAGIGLVRIRSLGRWTCAFWALLRVMTLSLILFYNIAFLYPGVQRWVPVFETWQDKQNERLRKANQQPMQRQNLSGNLTGNPVLDNIMAIVMNVALIGYAGIALLFMVLPATGDAIARYQTELAEGAAGLPSDDGSQDDEFRRERRRLDEPPNEGPI